MKLSDFTRLLLLFVLLSCLFLPKTQNSESAKTANTPASGIAERTIIKNTKKGTNKFNGRTEYPKQKQVKRTEEKNAAVFGDSGCLVVPKANIKVALYSANGKDKTYYPQQIVNRENSACLMQWGDGTRLIADHNYQGFSRLSNLSLGDEAYVEYKDGRKEYFILSDISPGINDGWTKRIDGSDPMFGNVAGINLYTCRTSRYDVIIYTFDPK